jgi:tetratricopeptide (TPR) repeat protein
MMPARWRRASLLLLLCFGCIGVLSTGCAGVESWLRPAPVAPARVSEAMAESSGARRASLRLVMDGLESDEQGSPVRAQGSYERALQVDPTNPYAFLALARHYNEVGETERAHDFLDQAVAQFEVQGEVAPDVDVLLVGLRGEIYRAGGQDTRAFPLLEEARGLAPDTWGDGHLSAGELW